MMGRVDFAYTRHKVPKPKWCPSWTPWRAGDALDALSTPELAVSIDGPVPVPSDAHSCHLEVEVPLGGGPRWLDSKLVVRQMYANPKTRKLMERERSLIKIWTPHEIDARLRQFHVGKQQLPAACSDAQQ